MKNLIKVAFLSSITTAALVYVILEWQPLRSDFSQSPQISLASSTVSTAVPAGNNLSEEDQSPTEPRRQRDRCSPGRRRL